MPNTTLDYTKAAQEKTLEAIKQSQSVIVEAVAAWAKAAEKTVPAFPAVPDIAETSHAQRDRARRASTSTATSSPPSGSSPTTCIAASAPVIKAPKTS